MILALPVISLAWPMLWLTVVGMMVQDYRDLKAADVRSQAFFSAQAICQGRYEAQHGKPPIPGAEMPTEDLSCIEGFAYYPKEDLH